MGVFICLSLVHGNVPSRFSFSLGTIPLEIFPWILTKNNPCKIFISYLQVTGSNPRKNTNFKMEGDPMRLKNILFEMVEILTNIL
jgi:hypothetical protein